MICSKEQGDTQLHGEEASNFTTTCTEVCGNENGSKSCSKTCLANVYSRDHPNNKIKAYVIIDDQSNCSLGTPRLFELLNLRGDATQYTLRTCSGTTQAKGRKAIDLVLESVDGSKHHNLPPIVDCDAIPNNRDEIPTLEAAGFHPHLRGIAQKIPKIDEEADILLLIGRDVPPMHKVHESRNGPRDALWAQRLDLGWVVIGNAGLNGAHKPSQIGAFKTHLLNNGRPSFMEPCPNLLYLECEAALRHASSATCQKKGHFINGRFEDNLGTNVFVHTKDDNKPGTSVENRKFLKIMDKGMTKDRKSGSWTAPLPLREETQHLPDNRENVLKRLKSTCRLLDRKSTMKEHYFTFMQKLLDSSHAEIAPVTKPKQRTIRLYLPHFGVYHPHKPGKIRVVFDSAPETEKVSLNKLLLSGPDLNNGLLGVLIRFRQDPVAFMADIEQIFHSFLVDERYRDLLRFFWYQENDPAKPLTEYRMRVCVFGNTSSPAVATYGLRKTAEVGESEFGSDAKELVDKNFYVADALKSVATPTKAIDLLKRTRDILATANLRLHKIASSHPVWLAKWCKIHKVYIHSHSMLLLVS